MGVIGFVAAGGGSIGVLAGGILTDLFSWHWIFLVNIPIGIGVVIASVMLLPEDRPAEAKGRLDVAGAITVTASLMLAVYAIVNGRDWGWTSGRTLGLLVAALVLLAAFLLIESRAAAPLVRLGLFKLRNFATANALGILMAGGLFATFFFSALYLQLVLGYSPLKVGLAYLPSTIIWGATSLFLSDKAVMRFGIKPPLVGGLLIMAAGVLLFARAPVDGSYAMDILPTMVLQGFGAGIAFNPILLAAMGDVGPEEAGLASGVVNTAFMMGGALGLAVLASAAATRSDHLEAAGHSAADALNGGYHLAFLLGAGLAVLAAVLGAALLHPSAAPAAQHGAEPATAGADAD
jgi:MFS family permease